MSARSSPIVKTRTATQRPRVAAFGLGKSNVQCPKSNVCVPQPTLGHLCVTWRKSNSVRVRRTLDIGHWTSIHNLPVISWLNRNGLVFLYPINDQLADLFT